MKQPNHGRKPVIRTLPPLAETCSEFVGFQGRERRAERIFIMLQTVIEGHRHSLPQPFYAMRDVAAFFGASLCTVSAVYRRLDRLGMLTRQRSSQTMIPARAPHTRIPVRGVVCYPIWLMGFLQFPDWRRLFTQLEDELSHHRFVLEPIFYGVGEEIKPAFVDRILQFNPDYVIWNNPATTDRTTMLGIRDTGVPLVVINGSPYEFPGRVYRQSYDRALRQGLQEWEACGEINQILVPRSVVSSSATYIIQSTLRGCALPHRFDVWDPDDPTTLIADYLKRLALLPRTGIIFDDDLFYTHLCLRRPEAMFELFHRHRVMVMREAVTPSAPIPEGTVDAILPNRRLARQIATDLSKGKGQLPYDGPAFEAEWRPRLPLAEVVQSELT